MIICVLYMFFAPFADRFDGLVWLFETEAEECAEVEKKSIRCMEVDGN